MEKLSEKQWKKGRKTMTQIILVELGRLLPVPIGKSGVNHRFQAISKIVEERRKN